MDHWCAIFPACLQHEHLAGWIHAKAVGHDAAGGTSTNNDVVVHGVRFPKRGSSPWLLGSQKPSQRRRQQAQQDGACALLGGGVLPLLNV